MLAHGSDTFSVLHSRKEMNLGAKSRTKLITRCENVFAQNEAIVFHFRTVDEGLTTCKTLHQVIEELPRQRSQDVFLDKVKNRRRVRYSSNSTKKNWRRASWLLARKVQGHSQTRDN
jgi:hypothetical protein